MKYLLLALILILFCTAAVTIHHVDYDVTLYLKQNTWPQFEDFYSRTLFEGDLPGAGDVSIIGMLICLVLYLFSATKEQLARWRAELGFGIFAGLISALCFVHTVKWVVGRARPKEVLKSHLAYSDWFTTGPHFISEGIYRGSFPSGHTLAALLPLLLAYMLAGNRENSLKIRIAGVIVGILALLNAGGMALARPMSLNHWISDGLLGMLIGWLLIHICYFWVLKVPQQRRLLRSGKQGEIPPKYWELKLGLLSVAVSACIIFALFGLRALFLDVSLAWALLLPVGIIAGIFVVRHWWRLYRRFLSWVG